MKKPFRKWTGSDPYEPKFQEGKILKSLGAVWEPGAYHGRGTDRVYFEGWYVKLVNQDFSERWAIIPGVFNHPDPERAHAFIQVLNGKTSQVEYHRFPQKDFFASRSKFEVQIGSNHFSEAGCVLDIESEPQTIQGKVEFGNPRPWPVRLLSPGVMGPFGLVPFMQTYHGVLSLDHYLGGSFSINHHPVSFAGGRGYLEKDWGSTFPRAYIWAQTNHFSKPGVSLTASVATIPWFGNWFRGFLVGLLVDGRLYRFATYLGSKIINISLSDHDIFWVLEGNGRSDPVSNYPRYRLELRAERGNGGLLSSPELDGMTPRILESLTASIEVKLTGCNHQGQPEEDIYLGKGDCAGLEVAGSVADITE